VCQAVGPRAPESKRAGLTDLARPTPLIGAFTLDPPPPGGFPRAPTGYPRPLSMGRHPPALCAPAPLGLRSPTTCISTPPSIGCPFHIYISCSLSLMIVVVVDVVAVVVVVCCLHFRAPFVLSTTPALTYVELLLCSSACASIPFS
jgi:hypothetical protein